MIKLKKAFTIIKFYFGIIITSITMSTINNANAIATVTADHCWWCCSGIIKAQGVTLICPNNGGQVIYVSGIGEESYDFCCCRRTVYSGECHCGPDGKTYCPDDTVAYGKNIVSHPPAAATCSAGPDGKTYCLASGSATYPSGISACYGKQTVLI